MRPNPLVTILTSCYNHEKYLDDYFQGLLSQTYSNIELILFDDGSPDGSWGKICSYEDRLRKKFPRVILERHENIGAAPELELALGRATGDLLCILESDDYYLPEKIEENVRYLQEHPEVGAVHSDTDYIQGKRIEHRHWKSIGRKIPSGDVFEALLVDNFIMTCSFCCRTDLYRRYVNQRDYLSKNYITGDFAIFLDLARHTPFGYIDRSLARYRVLANSWSHSTDLQKAFDIERSYQQIKLDYVEKYGGSDQARNLALEGMQQAHFIFNFRMKRAEKSLQAYEWLMQRNPERFGALPFRAMALSMRNRFTWRVMSWIVSIDIVQKATLSLFSLRNRGRAETDPTI